MAAPVIDRITLEDFLGWEAEQDRKFELVDGVPVMMTDGSRAHDAVRGAIYSLFRGQLRSRPCRAHMDVKVVCPSGNVRYPDAMIDCGPYRPMDVIASQPTIVVEVLSPSTQAADFLVKLQDYESVPSISTYAIFWQDAARAVVHRREGERLLPADRLEGLTGAIGFPDVNARLVKADIYDGVLNSED
jgi:Uma2 family endonuclease